MPHPLRQDVSKILLLLEKRSLRAPFFFGVDLLHAYYMQLSDDRLGANIAVLKQMRCKNVKDMDWKCLFSACAVTTSLHWVSLRLESKSA